MARKRQGAYKPKGAVNVRWSKIGTARQYGKKKTFKEK